MGDLSLIPVSAPHGLLFFLLKTPGEATVSARVSERTVITKKILPPDLVDALRHEDRKAEKLVEEHLCRLAHTSLCFVARPVGRRRALIEKALVSLAPAYAELRRRIVLRLPEIKDTVEAFRREHGAARSVGLHDEAWVERRFVLAWRWIPWMLSNETMAQLFSGEEQAAIQEEWQREAREGEAAKAARAVERVVELLATGVEALEAGRPVNRRTIACAAGLCAEGRALLEGTEHEVEMTELGVVVDRLATERAAYDDCGDRAGGRGELMRHVLDASTAAERLRFFP